MNGPAVNPLWSDAPGRWQVDGKVGDMNETLARAVALGAEMPVEVMAADGAFDPDAWLVDFNRAVARNCVTVPRPPRGWRLVYDYSVIVYWAHGYGPKVVGLERGDEPTSYFREEGDVS